MATTFDIKIKQDSLVLKGVNSPPETGLGETVLFLDSLDKQVKLRAESNGIIKELSNSSGQEVTRESIGAAASGVNLDITSVGSESTTTLIQGTLSLPQYSLFTAYNPIDQDLFNAQSYNPIMLAAVSKDKLGEFTASRFEVNHSGVYLLSAAVSVRIGLARPDWRIILAFYVNNLERSRGNDLSITGLYGGTSGTALLPLNAGDYVELFLYSQYPCIVFGGEAVTRMSGIRLS